MTTVTAARKSITLRIAEDTYHASYVLAPNNTVMVHFRGRAISAPLPWYEVGGGLYTAMGLLREVALAEHTDRPGRSTIPPIAEQLGSHIA
jgi:hypothetical protein